jgi:hypothetical protein
MDLIIANAIAGGERRAEHGGPGKPFAREPRYVGPDL